jgi:hypothetical protein
MATNVGNESTPEFDEFMNDDGIEVGEKPGSEPVEDEPAPKPKKAAPKPANAAEPEDDAAEPEDDASEQETGEEDDAGEEDDQPKDKKKKRKPSDRIRGLTRQLRDKDRQMETIIERLEKIGLPAENGGDTNRVQETPAPDPSDTDKYPLGHLDDRYIEDKLEWLAEKKAAERADAVLQRQQESERVNAARQQYDELLIKVDDLATRGSEKFDDFEDAVVKGGMRGDWDLSQTTFEAAHEVDNGAQILYELSQDKKEASRVAKLSAIQQLRYVEERDREISKSKDGRKVPKAGDPPQNLPRGTNSRVQINPATEDLGDFEKAWEADAKKSR